MGKYELTIPSGDQLSGQNQLDPIKNYDLNAATTDLAILTGCLPSEWTFCNVPDDNYLTGRSGCYWIITDDNAHATAINARSTIVYFKPSDSTVGIRPILKLPKISTFKTRGYKKTIETKFGEYPQYAPFYIIQNIIERDYRDGKLKKTGNTYTFNSNESNIKNSDFKPITYEEYEYQREKYIRVKANFHQKEEVKLSNGSTYKNGDFVWLKVSPVTWLVDEKAGMLISKKILVSGVRFLDEIVKYDGDFDKTDIKKYLDNCMSKEMFQGKLGYNDKQESEKNQTKKKDNPYDFNFIKVSEEEAIKGAIESNIAVFLHGPSSEGKSARVKQIDPDCEIIYLRNASPESLNGKSVYNAETGEMIDIKPSWLKKLEAKCEKEPDKLHILFFDEITNALPSIQGIAFNIVLDKEVNGLWKLPANARIVAAGNDTQDSLAANELAEPLFNRFAHVYIKTTTENWLKWASENNIHPAIITYIAFKNGKPLRSKYNGKKPNADPRKWEMASKMLYATGKPEMLRALVGETITKDFIDFCNQEVITLEYVLEGKSMLMLTTAKQYATLLALYKVDEANLETVRDFVKEFGDEFIAIFDALWTHGDEKRLERLAEIKLAETTAPNQKTTKKR